MIYLINFSIATICFYFSNYKANIKLNNKLKFNFYNIFPIIGILLLSILAGLRASNVGTDVRVYVINSFNRVSNYSSILQVIDNHQLEIGYEFLEYIISRFFYDWHWLLFFQELIIISGIYKFSKQFQSDSSWILIIISFLCIYYNQSYNAMRQWIAISIYLFSIEYLLKEKFIKYYAICIFAFFFHSSAIITFFIPIIYLYLKKNNYKLKNLIIVIFIAIILFMLLEEISLFFIKIGIFTNKYEHYFNILKGDSSIVKQIISRIPTIGGGIILYKEIVKHDKINVLIFGFLVIDLILGGFGSYKLGYIGRCSWYFGVWQCVFIFKLYNIISNKTNKKYELLMFMLFVLLLLIYWYYCYIYRGFSQTYPYTSDIISILNF